MKIAVVIPAAGIGQRMQADRPKQYLELHGKTILEHTVQRLNQTGTLQHFWLAIASDDDFFSQTPLSNCPQITKVPGGQQRADSVLNGLLQLDPEVWPWVLVHDAARPLVQVKDINTLIQQCFEAQCGGILATPVRDTMKRGRSELLHSSVHSDMSTVVAQTVEREQLWHALTPQLFPTAQLTLALQTALAEGVTITDEASAMEWAGFPVLLVHGRADNIKITQPEDLALAAFYLERQ